MAAPAAVKQQNIAINKARGMAFFEGSEVCFNYKTKQWTAVPAYLDLGVFSVDSKTQDIGLVRYSSGSVDLQEQLTSYPAQTAIITTGATDPNTGGRATVQGVRPLADGGTHTVRVGVQDGLGDTPTWSTVTSPHSRTNMANFRSEGRYVRVESTIAGGFTTVWGADVDFTPGGHV